MELQEHINTYWSKRADEFSECRLKDMESDQREIWTDLIRELIPTGKGLRALDVGTGAGFFSFLLSDLGFEVTGIDYSQAMIDNAKANAEKLGYGKIAFQQMDAQNLEFHDESFDFIISRNVTWTLPDPQKAYSEWCRVLAKGGNILNFDANYGHTFKLADEAGQTFHELEKQAHSAYPYKIQTKEMIRERNDIAKQLYICDYVRPQWDVDMFLKNGLTRITVDIDIGKRIYQNMSISDFDSKVQKESGFTSSLFMVRANKQKW